MRRLPGVLLNGRSADFSRLRPPEHPEAPSVEVPPPDFESGKPDESGAPAVGQHAPRCPYPCIIRRPALEPTDAAGRRLGRGANPHARKLKPRIPSSSFSFSSSCSCSVLQGFEDKNENEHEDEAAYGCKLAPMEPTRQVPAAPCAPHFSGTM